MKLHIGSIVWGVTDLERAIDFWTQALGYTCCHKDHDFAILKPVSGEGLQISLQTVTSEAARRHHMDLFSSDPVADAKRLLALGAKPKCWNYGPEADYEVFTDPDGNPFCIVKI